MSQALEFLEEPTIPAEPCRCRCGWDGRGEHLCHRCHANPGSPRDVPPRPGTEEAGYRSHACAPCWLEFRLARGVPVQGCCADGSCTPGTCMDLPPGTTCGDCAHIDRCKSMFGHAETDTYCDWFPRRFLALAEMKP